MLSEALDFPTRGADGATALLVGAGLLFGAAVFQLLGAVFLPLLAGALLCRIAVRGYYVRVYRRTTVDPGADAPAFDDWSDLFTDGLYSLVIFLVYLLPLSVLLGLAVGGGAMTSVDDPGAAVDALRNAAGLALLLALLYFLGMWYVLPAAVTNYAHEGELRAGFRLGEVLDGAVSEDYAVGWVLTVVVQVLIWPVAFVLQLLLVGFFVNFFVGVAVRSILGRSFGAARGLEPDRLATPWRETPDAARHASSQVGRRPTASGAPGREKSSDGSVDSGSVGDRGSGNDPGAESDSDAGTATGAPSGHPPSDVRAERETSPQDRRETAGDEGGTDEGDTDGDDGEDDPLADEFRP